MSALAPEGLAPSPPENAIQIVVTLPRAPKALDTNRRGSTKMGSGARATYRNECGTLVREAIQRWRQANPNAPRLSVPIWTRIIYGIQRYKSKMPDTTYKPRDAHNVHGPGKAIIDGMANVMSIDDCAKNVRDLGAEIDPLSEVVKLILWFTPLYNQTPPLSKEETHE